MTTRTVDAVMIGRAGVDLYGDQIGGRLEDMGSFSKYIGGSPTNTSIGAARLGLKTALISRVGNDAMGGFIREELTREGVNTDHLKTDHDRMTALVLLGIRDKEQFPLIFYRENCADMGLTPDDMDEDLIAGAKAVVTSGTHFSEPAVMAASMRALELAEKHGVQRWIDLDYRPVLWGLAGKGDGETRFVADADVSAHLQTIMPQLDVIVGTEEEIHIAGGSTDTITCLKTLRGLTGATFVVKLGAMGCAVFDGDIPDTIEGGLVVPGFPVEVYNVLGAGDAFMGGLVTGALEGRGWEVACQFANACGAFAVSRHACAPSYPSRIEMEHFIANGSPHFRLREDNPMEQLHWSTTRQGDWPEVLAFAFDHRLQMEEMTEDNDKIEAFKSLCADVVIDAQARHPKAQLGALCDHPYGQDALDKMTGRGLWLAAPVEYPGQIPLEFECGYDLRGYLKTFPRNHVVKCLFFAHPDDPKELWEAQKEQLYQLADATRGEGLELLLEVIPPKGSDVRADTIARQMQMVYEMRICPDWWKLGAPVDALWDETWDAWGKVLEKNDPYCRGIVLLGLNAPMADVKASVTRAAAQPLCKGFAVGRTIFGDAARAWLAGDLTDDGAKDKMAAAYDELIGAWR